MKTSILSILFMSLSLIVFAQDVKIKYGKVSSSDLAMKVYEPDPEAPAVVLSKIGRVRYDVLQDKYPLVEERHVVIKILNEAGIDQYGNVVLNYYDHNDYTQIGNIKGIVHLPDGTDVKLDNSQIFEERVNDFMSSKRIAFPKLVTGAIIEYQYSILMNNLFNPVDWFFQGPIPIVYSELTTKIPEWYDFVILTQGLPLDKKTRELTTESVAVSGMSRSSSFLNTSQFTQGTVNINFINHTYVNKDVPALKEECCITTMEDYYSRVRYQLRAIIYPNGSKIPIMNSWNEVAKELYDMPDWGLQFKNKRPGELVLEAAGLQPPTTERLQFVQKLYDFINSNFRENDYYSIGRGKEIGALLKLKSGSSGELNKLIAAALIQSGIPAKPVLVSTRDNGKQFELYPFLDQFNHMVVLAKVDGKDLWIDAGDKNLPLGLLRPDALQPKGWIVDEINPSWVDIKTADSKAVYYIKGKIDHEGNLNADVECRFTGYHALAQRHAAKDEKEKYGEGLLVSGSNSVNITTPEQINADDASMPFLLKARIENYPLATVTPDRIFIHTIIPAYLDDMPFKLEERTYPIEMNYPEEYSVVLDLEIPEGYTVETLPEPVKLLTESGGLGISYHPSESPGKINMSMKFGVRQLVYDPSEYAALKNMYNFRKQKFGEQVVLKKT